MKTALKFIQRYIFFKPWYVLVYPFFYFARKAVFPIRFFSQQELVDNLKRGKSLIRFGDGEINFFIGLGNPYQKYDPKIEQMLQEIVSNYKTQSEYMMAVSQPISVPNWELKTIGRHRVWQPFKIMFTFLFSKNVGYADTHQFYYDNFFEFIIAPIFTNKQVIVVTRRETIEKQKHNPLLPWKNIIWVEAPAGDAIANYDKLKASVVMSAKSLEIENTVIFFAVGPAGKYLMYELSKEHWQCIDIGKKVELMFTNESAEWLI